MNPALRLFAVAAWVVALPSAIQAHGHQVAAPQAVESRWASPDDERLRAAIETLCSADAATSARGEEDLVLLGDVAAEALIARLETDAALTYVDRLLKTMLRIDGEAVVAFLGRVHAGDVVLRARVAEWLILLPVEASAPLRDQALRFLVDVEPAVRARATLAAAIYGRGDDALEALVLEHRRSPSRTTSRAS